MSSNYVNYSNHVYVKISLGYEQLKEIDILRLVARGIHLNYKKKISTFSFPELSWKFAKFIILYLSLVITYYYSGINSINEDVKRNTKFYDYFPSQTYLLIENAGYENLIQNFFEKNNKPNNFNISDYIDGINSKLKNYSGRIKNINEILDTNNLPNDYFRYALINIDLFIQYVYINIRKNLPLMFDWVWTYDGNILKNYTYIEISSNAMLFPKNIDYFFWVYFILIWFITKYFAANYITRVYSHGHILKKLQILNDLIDSQVTKNVETKGTLSRFSFGFFKQKTYPRADVREIEKQLLEILDDIGRIPRYTRRPEFIIIFDELDKIEPHQNKILEEKEEEELNYRNNMDMYYNSEAVRSRQQNILKLLSNMKHFLTTAKSKFIFIAGREMYDASLADVSDRNNFLGSIFNEVIYVSSFMKDSSDKLPSDITSMTESYVCRYLFPQGECDSLKDYNLKSYNKYLKDKVFVSESDSAEETRLNNLKREKIIFTLQQFITYLTYRSNGTPKKITTFFEEFIVPIELKNVIEEDHLCIANNSKSLYLCFNFFEQYTFGMSTYLINPFFLSINKSIRDYGDKLLVSSSFLVDHLYKFHRVGFSWRNLELTPEIVDINKSPQLRELIGIIIKFLGRTHIQEIESGLYNFKFHRKISDEITLLSKISEIESAAFNFTLDESLTIKQHYKRKLTELNKAYSSYFTQNHSPEFIRSISFINMILGDLHFYDDEYDNAILQYMEAVQLIGDKHFEKLSIESQILFIRNTLKLGITFEKKKTYESAFMTYGKLAARIIKFRYVTNSDILQIAKTKLGRRRTLLNKEIKEIVNDIHTEKLTPDSEKLFFRFSIIENMRLIYQPLIARFQILEKFAPAGIQVKDIDQITKEYKFLLEDIIFAERSKQSNKGNIAIAEFENRIGDILYYKNGLVPKKLNFDNGIPDTGTDEENIMYCKRKNSLCFENKNINKILEKGFKTPCRACSLYMRSLYTMSHVYFNINPKHDEITKGNYIIEKLLGYLERTIDENGENYSKGVKIETVFKLTANILSDIGDTFLSCSFHEEEIRIDFLKVLIVIIDEKEFKGKAKKFNEYINNKKLNKIEEALIYYYLSASFYRRASDHREYSFQFLKILYVIRDYLIINGDKIKQLNTEEELIEKIKNKIVMRAIRGIYRTYENVHRLELEKYKGIFNISLNNDDKELIPILANYSVKWDLQEIIPLYHELKIMVEKFELEDLLKYRKKGFSSPYASSNSLYNRILQLKLQAKINMILLLKSEIVIIKVIDEDINEKEYWIVENLKNASFRHGRLIKECFGNNITIEEFVEFIISDSVFCLLEILRTSKIFGISYTINHSFIARAHERLADWCLIYKYYTKYNPNLEESLTNKIKDLIGADNIVLLAPHYHHEMAIHHLRQAHETHREGKAYKEIIDDMIYLNDDFNDNSYHFFAARERYRINSENLYNKINALKTKLQKDDMNKGEGTILYDIENYFSAEK